MHFNELNDLVRTSEDQDITIENCYGSDISQAPRRKNIVITGTPGTRSAPTWTAAGSL
jgi:hypothetical protein